MGNSDIYDGDVRDGTINAAVTIDRFGGRKFSSFAWLIIVQVRGGFIYAVPITDGHRVLQPSRTMRDYAVVYLQGTEPIIFPGDRKGPQGMDKKPLEIIPADDTINIDSRCRADFAENYSIKWDHWDVKSRNIGRVAPKHLKRLRLYWSQSLPRDRAVQRSMKGSMSTITIYKQLTLNRR